MSPAELESKREMYEERLRQAVWNQCHPDVVEFYRNPITNILIREMLTILLENLP